MFLFQFSHRRGATFIFSDYQGKNKIYVAHTDFKKTWMKYSICERSIIFIEWHKPGPPDHRDFVIQLIDSVRFVSYLPYGRQTWRISFIVTMQYRLFWIVLPIDRLHDFNAETANMW